MDNLRNIARWLILIVFLGFGLLYLNSTVFSLWAAGGPPTDIPNAWLHRARTHFGFSVALFATGIFAFKAMKTGFLTKGPKPWLVWLVIVLISTGYPPAKKAYQSYHCETSGGAWSTKHHECHDA